MSDHPLLAPAPHASRTAYANAVRKLNGRERAFVQAYLDGRNATRAYMAAYPDCKKSSAEAKAYKYLEKVGVREAILAFDTMMGEKLAVSKERWLREVAAVAFADHRHFKVNPDGDVTLRGDVPDEFGRTLTMKVRTTRCGDVTTTAVEYTQGDKSKALAMLGKHLGLLKGDTIQVNQPEFTFTLAMLQEAERQAVEQGLMAPIPRPQPKYVEGVTTPVPPKSE